MGKLVVSRPKSKVPTSGHPSSSYLLTKISLQSDRKLTSMDADWGSTSLGIFDAIRKSWVNGLVHMVTLSGANHLICWEGL